MSATKEKTETSEERFGIMPQPGETCPMINKAQQSVKNAMIKIHGYDRIDDVKELHSMLRDVEYELESLCGYRDHGILEEIRANVSEIREWGQQWKCEAKKRAESPTERA